MHAQQQRHTSKHPYTYRAFTCARAGAHAQMYSTQANGQRLCGCCVPDWRWSLRTRARFSAKNVRDRARVPRAKLAPAPARIGIDWLPRGVRAEFAMIGFN